LAKDFRDTDDWHLNGRAQFVDMLRTPPTSELWRLAGFDLAGLLFPPDSLQP